MLGPMRVVVAGRTVPIASARQRAVLTALLLRPSRPVSADRLIDTVWGPRPAASAHNLVRTYIWRLRALLVEDGERRVVTEPAGYLLRVEPGELDLAEFERLAAHGRAALARDEVSEAAASLRAALDFWRGEPFADATLFDGDHAAEIQRLAEARIAALQDRIEADLALGRHEDVLPELRQFALQHPLRERNTGLLMLACYRAGRTADALDAYRSLRAALIDNLGVDPGGAIKELHQRILNADPGLLAGQGPRRPAERIAPRQLPAVPEQLTGRAEEIKALTRWLERTARAGSTAGISAIDGTAGIGKTALAVYWAHQVSGEFPDGQLYVNLGGFGPTGPMAPGDALRSFLDAFAVAPASIAARLDDQAALYRSVLSGKRVLVVLDNARDAAQVRPLLPGSPGCFAVVTSRTRLSGLIAEYGAHALSLDLLPPADAVQLLAARLGRQRISGEPEAVRRLVGQCARLPLALAIVAARAAVRPTFPLAALAAELSDAEVRLDALADEEPAADIRTVFSWSYRVLGERSGRLFRLLGLHRGADIGVAAAASLAGLPLRETRQALAELARTHLVAEHTPGRYLLHDLLAVYAAELVQQETAESQRDRAVRRLLDHYLHSAHTAARLLYPQRDPITLPQPDADSHPEDPGDHDGAMAWFTVEHPVLLAVILQAAALGRHTYTWQLAWCLRNFLQRRGYWHDLVTT